ncbi:hypothetical protein [Amycolatopsis sp. 195334CR]|uniref:hypothetical protein n=1 Tax=Amycolatopsis sp. 195334CR TaxID=2814588 RepID=UPI001A8F91C3|nr:hypothetical protein [Amycolatopsis sp. 195334CR]MBN6042025.1 hypothetical protein [Amycolatopsis sp. 195334CR]
MGAEAAGGKTEPGQGQVEETPGEQDRGLSEAYTRGQRFLSESAVMSRYTTIIGEAEARSLHIGDNVYIGSSLSRTSGSVPADVLAWTKARYVPVSRYDEMFDALGSRRVIFIRGLPGTGRATTALHLLDRVTGGKVFRLDSGEKVESLTDRELPHEEAGYVIELTRRVGNSLTEVHLEKLRDQLEEKSSYCVLIGETDPRHDGAFGGYAFPCVAPEPGDLLRAHIIEEIRGDETAGFEEKLSGLIRAKWVSAALGTAPRPIESARMAALLAEHARGGVTREEVEREADGFAYDQVAEWFAALQALRPGEDLDEALRLAGFRIALAVLNEAPFNVVAEVAALLSQFFIDAMGTVRTRRTSLFSDDQETRLPALRAHLVNGYAVFDKVRVATELLAFQDDRYPITILKYVWRNHHHLRAEMVRWLMKLSKHTVTAVWVRSAQAAGYLCSLDFSYAFSKVIVPGARAEYSRKAWQRKMFAALALDQAGQDGELRAAIDERLCEWRRRGLWGERWTAAAAWGFTLGRESPERAFEELRVLGTQSELRVPVDEDEAADVVLMHIAGRSLARLLAGGAVREALARIEVWNTSGRSSLRRLAVTSLAYAANLDSYELAYLQLPVSGRSVMRPGSERWPLLLVLQADDPGLTEPIANLIRGLLRSTEGERTAREFLRKWFRAAEFDAECMGVLVKFLPNVVHDQNDTQRLCYLIEWTRTSWEDPLRDDVAKDLVAAVSPENEKEPTS